ncbi:hypothetical protein N656DRAFT_842784 [Canariomyces notabilis]|uniref:AAR2 N-terminal domain-containing protein n=1 Tax=Canariomyces notabilis TaxID=2074819 RepID=A0AAN6YV69_9PEZI|nr:hypothetical protein N656DRAFT_842784 [Canariomyces arenarius]
MQAAPAWFEKGDVFELLDLPDDFIVGLDDIALTTNKCFRGFRDIPQGPHFLWVQQPGSVLRCGYWFVTGKRGTLRVKHWDSYNEVLAAPSKSDYQLESQSAHEWNETESAYPTLHPYTSRPTRGGHKPPLNPVSAQPIWHSLTWAISPVFLGWVFATKHTTAPGGKGSGERVEYPIDSLDTHTPILINEPAPSNDDPKTPQDTDKATLLAELQYTFVSGTLLSNTSCLARWWQLVLNHLLQPPPDPMPVPHHHHHHHHQLPPEGQAALLQTLHAQLFFTEHYLEASTDTNTNTDPNNNKPSSTPSVMSSSNRGTGAARRGPSADRSLYLCLPGSRTRLKAALAGYRSGLERLGATMLGGTEGLGEVGRAFAALEGWLNMLGWDLSVYGSAGGGGEEAGGGGSGGNTGIAGDDVDDDDGDDGENSDDHEEDAEEEEEEDEEDEYPVIVELDAEGREVGLVSFRD